MATVKEKRGELAELLASELEQVRGLFAAELTSDLPCVNDLSLHLEQYRGKMLRPTLVLLAGWAASPGGQTGHAHRTIATVIEMVHVATLVHDDVLDESPVRRRGSTVNHLRGNETAVMLGDYLISHAYHLCSSLESQAVARLIARTTNTVCEGELLQLSNRNNWALDEPTYFQIIHRKTASLCGVGCQLGALCAGADEEVCRSLSDYGHRIGTAFQIIDDVLDLTGDPEVVGKAVWKDLEKGKLTLPVIHCLRTADEQRRRELLELLRSGERQRLTRIAHLVAEGDSVAYARRCAQRLVDEAREALQLLPESAACRTLLAMADAVVERER